MAYSSKNKPDFERPPVAEWMSSPKSSDLPVWDAQHASVVRPSVASSYQQPSDSAVKNTAKAHEEVPTNLHLELEEASSGWTTPTSRPRQTSPRSRRNLNAEHFSLQLSPRISITLHSPKGVSAVVTSKKDETKKKFSLKIRSHRKRGRKRTSSSESSLEGTPAVMGDSSRDVPPDNHHKVESSVPSVFPDERFIDLKNETDNPPQSRTNSERGTSGDRDNGKPSPIF